MPMYAELDIVMGNPSIRLSFCHARWMVLYRHECTYRQTLSARWYAGIMARDSSTVTEFQGELPQRRR